MTNHLGKGGCLLEKQLVFALFVDKIKISDYGSISFVKATDYKQSK